MQRLCVLGATGSIGASTLDVVARHPDQFSVFALSADKNIDRLASLCRQFSPRYAVLSSAPSAAQLQQQLRADHCRTEVLYGAQSLIDIASHADVDVVMAAIVGAAGLLPTLAAARAGKRILLANKEALVMSGNLLLDAVQRSGATLLPIDSEHNAIFQCLPAPSGGDLAARAIRTKSVEKIILTASGGPFLYTDISRLSSVTPDQACAHPTWAMGRKISVDSATLMNKGLEVIEASLLFCVGPDDIDVVVHPQSIVHSMVRYVDGSVLAQMGNPDMRTPIAHALAYPERLAAGVTPLDLTQVGQLQFLPVDTVRFPCLQLAYQVLRAGGSSAAVLNAANEVAVTAFLAGELSYTAIAEVIAECLAQCAAPQVQDIESLLSVDATARVCARQIIQRRSTQ